ncbi:MAG: DUF1592 domain-containing protein [Pirellulaceae bacterium]
MYFLSVLLLASVCLGLSATAEDAFTTRIAPVLERRCRSCHGEQRQEGRIRLDEIREFRVDDRHLWTMVHEKLSAGQMPPEDAPQLTAAEREEILKWIETRQRAIASGSTRRLNRREFSAALRDATGLSVDFSDAMPGDGKVDGFDTGAAALQDAADSVARWMTVTRRAVDGIRFLEPASEQIFTADLLEVKDARKVFDPWKVAGATAKLRGQTPPGVGMLIEPKWVGERGGQEFLIPPPSGGAGVLRLKLVVAAVKPLAGVPNPHLWVEIGGRDIDYREITGTPAAPQHLVYEVQIDDLAIETKGLGIELSTRVEVPYAVEGFENEDKSKPDEPIPGGPGLFRPVYDRKSTPYDAAPAPFIALQRIEIEPNYVAAWPPPSWNVDSMEIEDSPACAEALLELWIERAWRRPVEEAEQARFLALYAELRRQGLSFDEALRAVFQSVLLSGSFRYLAPPDDADPVVAQHAIASRLSFMLWGAPPDDELRKLAAAGKLRDPKVLDEQVDRLLDDPRSDAFVRPFVVQWLEIGQPITITMDYFQKQDFRFARFLKASMREETVRYVEQMIAENRPARELVDSDWTMMNNSLAAHYGYDGISGGELRKVKLRGDDVRGGGILGQAGIQSMLCWMGENWVIYRGAWTLRHILDDPPPPPPLEVPELIPSDGENRGKTFRELLVQHQADAKCSVCHKKMDPLGFAFQNFDISGRWRDVEYDKYVRNELDGKIEWRGEGETRLVDTAGKLPRGEQFESFEQFKQLVVDHYMEDMVGGLLKNLMLYGAGRTPDVGGLAEIRAIMRAEQRGGYRLRNLIKRVVRSEAFLGRGALAPD